MIKSVTVTNFKGESLKLTLAKPEESGIIVQSISGLGPPKATINSTTLATADGSIFNSARHSDRQIIFNLIMMWTPQIEDSRQKIYKYFPVKKRLKILVETDNRLLETEGYVDSNDPDIFSEQESTSISVTCTDPYFYENKDGQTIFSGVKPLFEFPFSGGIVPKETDWDDPIEFGEILLDTRAIIYYDGDIDMGVRITIHAMGSAENITLFNPDTREQFKIITSKIATITGKIFNTGDDIIISTVKGNKYVQLLRNGVYTNIIGAVDKNSDWFQLTSGDNIFGFIADSGENNLMVTFDYRKAYGGI